MTGMAVRAAMPPGFRYSGATENNLSRGREARLFLQLGACDMESCDMK